jgi:hypothetical protein
MVLPKTAELVVPGWMWGGDPTGYFVTAGLKARGGEPLGRWRVQTVERYRGQRPSLAQVDHLAGPNTRRPRLDLLAGAAVSADAILPDVGGQLPRELAELREPAIRSGLPVDGWSSRLADTSLAPADRLVEVVEAIHRDICETAREGDPAARPHADAGVHLVRRDPMIVHRAKLTSTLLQVEHDPVLQDGDLATLRAGLAAGPVLASSQGLFEGIVLFDAYLGPLLGALAPHVWAFAAPRVLECVGRSADRPLRQVSRKSHSEPSTQRRAESLPFHIPHSKSLSTGRTSGHRVFTRSAFASAPCRMSGA